MSAEITVKGRSLAECSDADLYAEWEGGMYLDCSEGLTPEQEARMIAIEREMAKRPSMNEAPPAPEDAA